MNRRNEELLEHKELQSLRAWKEKAKPFLEECKADAVIALAKAGMIEDITLVDHWNEYIKTLTELLEDK